MKRKLYGATGLLIMLVIAASFFVPGESPEREGLPWQIEHPAPGETRVFGLALGSSSAAEAERRFNAEAKPSLFRSPDGRMAAEMFFDQVALAGLKARIVITIAVPAEELQAMYERGLRISATGGGKKITPAPDDAARLRALPVGGLTYMPSVRVDGAVFLKRFGQPQQRIREREGGAVHWLYPQHGLDITLGSKEKPVLQYVPLRDFGKLLQPLLDSGEAMD